ncbi:MAG: lipase maturation factor family protein [Candidatus Eisenbacteria bacterium]
MRVTGGYTRHMTNGRRPLLVFDGDCGFCRAWVARWRPAIDGWVDVAPSQQAAREHPQVPAARFAEAVVLIEPDGSWLAGAAAVFRALAHAPGHGAWWWVYRHLPGAASLTETVYRLVAGHRRAGTAVTHALWGGHVRPPGERFTAWVFVRLVGAIHLVAFASLAVQIRGLAGHDGILPAARFLAQVAARYGPERFLLLPSLVWLDASDGFLVGLCVAGMIGSALVTLGFAPRALLLGLWAAYLSLASVGGEFLWFQWDGLLLECGVVAALLAPWSLRSRPGDTWRPTRAAVWLARWLLFRLMFSSAVVKLASGDPTWRHLTALQFHYETQPLPPWTAWYAHHLPAAFQGFSALMMFGIEGLVPLLIFTPRRARMLAAAAITFLQTLILITGNYGFFNWLTLALCVMLLDDAAWPRLLRRVASLDPVTAPGTPSRAIGRRVASAVAIVLLVLGLTPLLGSMRVPMQWLGPLPAAYELMVPFRTVNAYGLFAVMTTERSEIVVEGSADGVTWKPYGFRWKPGDVSRKPEFVPGHMPRLDWQMWFAALDPTHPAPWLVMCCERLLEGSKPVRALLGADPFPVTPPRYVRADLYRYRFSDAATRHATGAWWTRERQGPYLPALTMREGRLVIAMDEEPGR